MRGLPCQLHFPTSVFNGQTCFVACDAMARITGSSVAKHSHRWGSACSLDGAPSGYPRCENAICVHRLVECKSFAFGTPRDWHGNLRTRLNDSYIHSIGIGESDSSPSLFNFDGSHRVSMTVFSFFLWTH